MGNTKGPVHEQFSDEAREQGTSSFKETRVRCKYCGHSLVEQANRMNNHLKKCLRDQQSLEKRSEMDREISLKRAKKAATGWFYLTDVEEKVLEDDRRNVGSRGGNGNK